MAKSQEKARTEVQYHINLAIWKGPFANARSLSVQPRDRPISDDSWAEVGQAG
jgi:hypothetical protein